MGSKTDLEKFRELGNEMAKFVYSPVRKMFVRAVDVPSFMDTGEVCSMIAQHMNINIIVHSDGVEIYKV